jgi:excisionase family DNA binding protein
MCRVLPYSPSHVRANAPYRGKRHKRHYGLKDECMNQERQQPEWLDLKALHGYACVSERTIREWIHRSLDPLLAVRVGTKILIRRTVFDRWLEAHQVKQVDVGCIVDELIEGVTS